MFVYLCSLAAADLTVAVFGMSGMAVVAWYGYWPFSYDLCVLWLIMDTSSGTISIYHLCLIAWERYEALTRPLKYRAKHGVGSRRFCYISIVWLSSIAAWVPVTLLFPGETRERYGNQSQCFFIPGPWEVTIQCIVVFYLPLAVMLFLYIRTVHSLINRIQKTPCALLEFRQNSEREKRECLLQQENHHAKQNVLTKEDSFEVSRFPVNTNDSIKMTENHTGSQSRRTPETEMSKQKRHLKRKQCIDNIRLLGLVIAVMMFCWIPFSIVWPLKAHGSIYIHPLLYEYTYWIAYLNSSLNPFVYFISNSHFRASLFKVFGKLLNCK